MRISTQLIKSKAKPKGHLHTAVYVDLSNNDINRIEKLGFCPMLKSLDLSGNNIESISNLESCSELWKIDLNNNKVRSLEGLSRFIALGTLVLSNNDLSWSELERIRHMHIIDLVLHGNPQLEKDPYYRLHVIDCLPNLWMLDGRLITSAERAKVESFFNDSAITNHPVRHKLRKQTFTPSSQKNIALNGIYGAKTTQLFKTFPVNAILNIAMDKKRLMYMALDFEDDLVTEGFSKDRVSFVHKLLCSRDKEIEKCNMLLLLLVASLDFSIPIPLMEAVLDASQLAQFSDVSMMSLFLLPKDIRCSLLCFLLGSVKLERDGNMTGGLYDELYLCLYNNVSELTRQSRSPRNNAFNINKKTMALLRESRALIAAEVIHLFCVVPKFFEYIISDEGIQQMVNKATGDNFEVLDKVNMILFSDNRGMTLESVHQVVAKLIADGVEQASIKLLKSSKMSNFYDETLKPCTQLAIRRSPSPQGYFGRSLKMDSNKSVTLLAIDSVSGTSKKGVIKLGDRVLLGPQNMAKVISIPDPKIVMVQMDVVPAPSGAMIYQIKKSDARFAYIDTAKLEWDTKGHWRPRGTVGDRITIRPAENRSAQVDDRSMEDTSPVGFTLAPKTSPQNLVTAPAIPCAINLFADNTKIANKVEEVADKPKSITMGVSAQYKEKLGLPNPGLDGGEIDDNNTITAVDSKFREEMKMKLRPTSANMRATMRGSSAKSSEGKRISRHSSLESEDDADLEYLANQTFKLTAVETAVENTAAPQKQDDADPQANVNFIKIPQDTEDAQTPRYSSLSADLRSATPNSAAVTPRSPHVVTFKDLLLNSNDTTGIIMNRDVSIPNSRRSTKNMYRGYHQSKFIEDLLANPTSGSSKSSNYGPTPTPNTSRPSSSNADRSKWGLKVQHGNVWLGQGRDLYSEDRSSRPSSSHQPGWKEGLPSRPASAMSRQSSASGRSTGRSSNYSTPASLKQNDYASAVGSVTGHRVSNRRPKSPAPRSKDTINIEDYSFINPKRVRFVQNRPYEGPSQADDIFIPSGPSPLILQRMSAKNRQRKLHHQHKSGILCVECAYQQYQSQLVEQLYEDEQVGMDRIEDDLRNNFQNNFDNPENEVQFDLDADLENQDITSTYEPMNVLVRNDYGAVDASESERVMKSAVDLDDLGQSEGQNVPVPSIAVHVVNHGVTDSNSADMQDGSV